MSSVRASVSALKVGAAEWRGSSCANPAHKGPPSQPGLGPRGHHEWLGAWRTPLSSEEQRPSRALCWSVELQPLRACSLPPSRPGPSREGQNTGTAPPRGLVGDAPRTGPAQETAPSERWRPLQTQLPHSVLTFTLRLHPGNPAPHPCQAAFSESESPDCWRGGSRVLVPCHSCGRPLPDPGSDWPKGCSHTASEGPLFPRRHQTGLPPTWPPPRSGARAHRTSPGPVGPTLHPCPCIQAGAHGQLALPTWGDGRGVRTQWGPAGKQRSQHHSRPGPAWAGPPGLPPLPPPSAPHSVQATTVGFSPETSCKLWRSFNGKVGCSENATQVGAGSCDG